MIATVNTDRTNHKMPSLTPVPVPFMDSSSWVDRVLPELAPPDVFGEHGLTQLEVVVRREARAGIHHQIRRRPQVAGDRLPAPGAPAGSTASVHARQIVRI